jgi:hypothetical protein
MLTNWSHNANKNPTTFKNFEQQEVDTSFESIKKQLALKRIQKSFVRRQQKTCKMRQIRLSLIKNEKFMLSSERAQKLGIEVEIRF